jgi:ribosomal protein S18 acetylase RimI-like enzyme
VVGYLVLLDVTRKPNLYSQERAFAYVDQICVAQGSRGQGVGRALIARAADRARELGRDRLELDVWSDNQRAKSAFQALGFRTYTEKMKLELS